jgi:hypothetical protein
MHIHGSQMNLNAMNPYSAAAEKAAATERALNVAKKLKKAAADSQGVASPEEPSLLAKSMEGNSSRLQGGVEYSPSGKDSDLG